MNRLSSIGSYLKKLYRIYSQELLNSLQNKGFTDLRPSFLEVLLYICENEGSSIKEVGQNCGLKKQTMTSHLNELEKRGYTLRKINPNDRREQNIFLTDYGQKFKFSLLEAINDIEEKYSSVLGRIELERIDHVLKNFHEKIADEPYKGVKPLSLFSSNAG